MKIRREDLYLPSAAKHLQVNFLISKGIPHSLCECVLSSSWPQKTSDPLCLTVHQSPLASPRSPMRQRSYFRQLLIPSLHKKVLPYMEPKSDFLAFNLLALLSLLGPYVKQCLSHCVGILVGNCVYKNKAIQDLGPQAVVQSPDQVTLLTLHELLPT